ncbi:Ig-like domain (group 2) [Butyrivibrio sp. INlla18]|uniref:GH25 family lysozyme n=1 Tax=Butyrivibrio sp. INlla18 TaxID=1520806 RepID=UPI00088093A8|nr:GH25 family lysozyme [Butyrivibrio sp. INlla18]SDA69506.1 Ig-like domain (group 2) [Butyrivibrio sp. INlla18]
MKRSTKKGLGLFGKKSRTKRHDERIDFDEQYDQYEDDYEDYDPEYDDDYDRQYDDDDYDRDDDREYEDDYDDYDRRDDRDYEDEDYDRDDRDYEDDRYDEDDYARDDDRDYEDDYDRDEDRYEDEEDDDRYEDDVDDREYNGIPDDEYDREYEDEYYEDEEDYDREDDRYEDDDYDRDDRGYDDDDRYDDEYDRDYDDRYEDDYDRYDDDEDDYAPDRGRRDRGGRRNRSRDRRESGAAIFFAAAFEKIKNTSAVERIAAAVFLFLIAGAVATGIFYKTASTKNEQISSFADVGTTLSEVEVVGESGLLAMADAEKAKAMTAQMVEEEEEEEEIADDAKGVTVQMTLTSIKSDLKIKFINSETKKLVGNVHFEVSVKCPDGSTVTFDDHDKDGIIYKKDIKAGKYTVTPMALSDEYSTYTLDTSSKTITVKDTVEMKAVDVSNEVKKESQVNAAKEDTQVKTEVESQLKDTVEWVESTKTPVGESSDGEYSYEEINKDSITPPGTTAKLTAGSFMRMAGARNPGDSSSLTSNDDAASNKSSKESSEGGNGTGGSGEGGGSTDTPGEGGGSTTPKEKVDIEASITSADLTVGQEATISISKGPSNPDITSDNSSVATVSGKTVKAVGSGKAKITIKGNDDYKEKSFEVNVKEEPNKDMTVEVTPNNIKVGEKATVKITGPSNPTVTQSGGDGQVKITGTTVEGTKKGSVTLKVTADKYNAREVTLTVDDPAKKNFETSAKEITVKEKETVDIASALSLKNAPSDIKYTSSDANIAKVEDNKKVTGVAAGKSTTITLTANGYNDYPVTVKVVGKDTVPVSFTKATLVEGQNLKITANNNVKIAKVVSSDTNKVTVNGDTITGKAAGDVTLTVSADNYTDAKIEVKVVGKGTVLKDKSGNTVYVKDGDKYREATYQDYYDGNKKFYLRKAATAYKYTGWQTIDGKTYFYDKNGDRVKGEQVIQGAKYTFDGDGALVKSPGAMGIDVSKWNGNIDWNAVKNSGVNFVIIRCGYRGSSQGTLIEDPKFRANIKGAQAAGLRVGVYFFTQAVNEVEAVEEASMVISLCKGYSLSFPVYLDVEGSNGRGDKISADQRTANIKAFCGTIKNAGYQVGVYANKTWFTSKINTSQITGYKIWLAQYASQVTYTGSRYDMWQYTSKGKVTGISGNVDMNICY